MPGVRVIIIDSNSSFSRSVRNYFTAKKETEMVKVASTCSDITSLIDNLAPDLLLIDEQFAIAGSKVQAIISKVKIMRPEAKVLIMTLYPVVEQAEHRLATENITGVITKQNFMADIQPYL